MGGLTVVVSPLIALMQDQVNALRMNGVAAESINSAKDRADNVAAWRRVGLQTHNLLAFAPAPGRTLLDWLIEAVASGGGEPAWGPWIDQLARETYRLHAARFTHGDLLPGNVMAESPTGPLWLLDNDRTRR